MYISSLDRPWLDTPFTLQGFRLQSEEDIRRLQKYCQYVYVDPSMSVQDATIVRRKMRNRPRLSNQELFANRTLKRYTEACSWEEEYPRALKAVMTLSKGIEVIYSKMSDSSILDMVTVKKCIEPVVDSIVRLPGACIWLARLKQEDRYTYQHPLGAAIWAVALGSSAFPRLTSEPWLSAACFLTWASWEWIPSCCRRPASSAMRSSSRFAIT